MAGRASRGGGFGEDKGRWLSLDRAQFHRRLLPNFPRHPRRPYPYQASLYQGFTIQSLSFAWFHVGLRTRETYALGFSEPYQEPMLLKLQGSVEVLPDLVYRHPGRQHPPYPARNGHRGYPGPLPGHERLQRLADSDFLSPQALHAAAFGATPDRTGPCWPASATRAPRCSRWIPGKSFFPAAYFDFFARAIYQGRAARHRLDLKSRLRRGRQLRAHPRP